MTFESMFAGFTYIWNRKILLGVVSLDLFAVLVSGVTALLPIFARDVLETGPWGLGLLALGTGGRRARHVGHAVALVDRGATPDRLLFATVAVYGAAITAFGLSTSLMLSLIALAAYGAADSVSVVIRHSLVQSRTPNDMLGRVMAANLDVHRRLGIAGRFPRRTDGGLVGRGAGGAVRRYRRHGGDAHLDARLSRTHAHPEADWRDAKNQADAAHCRTTSTEHCA